MDVNDYLIDQEDKDWADLLSSWQFLLPESFNVWLVNRLATSSSSSTMAQSTSSILAAASLSV